MFGFAIAESLLQLLPFVVFSKYVFFICIPQLSLDCVGQMDFVMMKSLLRLLPFFHFFCISQLNLYFSSKFLNFNWTLVVRWTL